MSRFVTLHKLIKAFTGWDYQYHEVRELSRTLPVMSDEFSAWWYENETLVKKVHTEKSFELDAILIILEFHNEEEALICRLRFG